MSDSQTYQLFVRLSASQARKRLVGHGFGVRNVETVEKNRAVIRHTATGGHLQQLRILFSDVLEEAPESETW